MNGIQLKSSGCSIESPLDAAFGLRPFDPDYPPKTLLFSSLTIT